MISKNNVLLSLGLFFAMVVVGYFAFHEEIEKSVENKTKFYMETDTPKFLSAFSFSEGDRIEYVVNASGRIGHLTYVVNSSESECDLFQIYVDGVKNDTVCVDPLGFLQWQNKSILFNPVVVPTQPWALLVEDGWKWNVSIFLSGTRIPLVFYENGSDNYMGRAGYVVVSKSPFWNSKYLVDKEKRIILWEESENISIRLINYSFS